jgi:hypothetical protein
MGSITNHLISQDAPSAEKKRPIRRHGLYHVAFVIIVEVLASHADTRRIVVLKRSTLDVLPWLG